MLATSNTTVPKKRGHRGEFLAHALSSLGSSAKSASWDPPAGQDLEGGASPVVVEHSNVMHKHGSVRASFISAVISPAIPAFFSRAPISVETSLADLKAAHMDGRKVSNLDEGRTIHSGHLNMLDKKHGTWVRMWCLVADDCTLYVCPEKGLESVAALPMAVCYVIDVSEKEMTHPLCIEAQFPLTMTSEPGAARPQTLNPKP